MQLPSAPPPSIEDHGHTTDTFQDMKTRIEKDTLGEVAVPADQYWGAQTERSRHNFPIGPAGTMPIEVVHAFGHLKMAAAKANCDLGVLEAGKRDLIVQVCQEIIAGRLDDCFPLVVWQTGSGTQSNMNVNEVIANRAHVLAGGTLGEGERPVHPNDDANKSQSSNDTFPDRHAPGGIMTALCGTTLTRCAALAGRLGGKSRGVERRGQNRPHPPDGCDPAHVRPRIRRLCRPARPRHEGACATPWTTWLSSHSAGTAVGTGLNAPEGYAEKVAAYMAESMGHPFVTAPNKFEALAAHDAVVEAHGALKQLAVSCNKMAHDIRMMGSGPAEWHRRTGPPRQRARLQHHAGQGQPDPSRGPDHGLRPSDGQRRRRDHWRGSRAFRTQCLSSR